MPIGSSLDLLSTARRFSQLTTATTCRSRVLGSLLILTLIACRAPATQQNNAALGKRVDFSPVPNYPLTTDPGDPFDLTDGKAVTAGRMWTSRASVGWKGVSPIFMSIDLGTETSLDAIEITTAAGTSGGVKLPRAVVAYGSDDGKKWARLGILQATSTPVVASPYANYIYRLSNLSQACRIVRLAVVTAANLGFFTDQMRILTGTANRPLTTVIDDLNSDLQSCLEVTLGRARAIGSAGELRDAAVQAGLNPDQATWAKIAQAHGVSGVRIWKQYRFGPLGRHDFPTSSADQPRLSVELLKGEQRGDAFLVTNAGDFDATIRIEAVGTQSFPSFLKVAASVWTAAFDVSPEVATSLPYIRPTNGTCGFTVKSGSTTRVWIEVDATTLDFGKMTVNLSVDVGAAGKLTVPISISVPNITLNESELSLGGWDYADGYGAFAGLPASSAPSYWQLVAGSGIDTASAFRRRIPIPKPEQFSGGGVTGLDLSMIDDWIRITPGIHNRIIVLRGAALFADAPMGTDLFVNRLGAWVRALTDRVAADDSRCRIVLLIIDEASSVAQAEICNAWIAVIRRFAPAAKIFVDPSFSDLGPEPIQHLLDSADIICTSQEFVFGCEDLASQYRKLAATKELWIYTAEGNVFNLDPTDFYRLLPWRAFAEGAKGILFWSFTDIGGAKSSWNGSGAYWLNYSPLFLGTPMCTSIHWEALREGMWDNRLFRELAKTIKGTTEEAAGEDLLAKIRAMGVQHSGGHVWTVSPDSDQADALRAQATAMLVRLQHR